MTKTYPSEGVQLHRRCVRLVGAGKFWGELRIEGGRLLLDAKRNGRHVRFDLLASVEQDKAVWVAIGNSE